MKRLTKSFLVIALAVAAILSFVSVINFSTVKKAVAESETETMLANLDFEMQDSAQVRIGLTDDGNGGLVATDYNDNGIRFTATMAKSDYEALEDSATGIGKKMVFGILVMPKDYLGETPITADDVFGNSGEFTISETDTTKTRVAFVETNALKEGEDCYYMQASMVKLLSVNKDREFIGIPYLKAINELGFIVYKVKDYSLDNARSMAYIAQKEYEKNNVNATIKTALYSSYIDGLTADFDVTYIVSYDGMNGVSETKTLTFNLNDEIDAQAVKTAIDAIVDGNVAEYGSIGFTKNLATVSSAKVYANGKNDTEITANYNVKESDDYSEVKNYYITGDNSVVLGNNNALVGNADYANGNSTVNGTYKLYVDDKIKINYSGETYLAAFSADGFEFGGDYYEPSITVPNGTYRNIRGYYVNGGNFVVINEKGGISKNLRDTGISRIYFDKANLNFKMYVAMLNADPTETVINLGNPSVTVGGDAYSLSDTKTLATMEQYAAFANAYKGDYYYPWQNWGINTYFDTAVKVPQTVFTFKTDGSAVYDGTELYRYSAYIDGEGNANNYATKFLARVMGKKEGGYVLFSDGTFKVMMRDIAVRKTRVSSLVDQVSYAENIILDGDFDDENYEITVNFTNDNKLYLPTFVLTADSASTETVDADSAVDLDELYTDFTVPQEGENYWYVLRTDTSVWGGGSPQFMFKADGTFNAAFNWGSKTGTYELTPVNKNYGTIKMNFVVDNTAPSGLKEANGYYTYIDGFYKLRINFKDITSAGCFSELRVGWWSISGGVADNVGSMTLAYNPLVGTGGTAENPATRTFVSLTNNDTLVLKNDGILTVDKVGGGTQALCGRGVYTPDGEEGQDFLYSLVPTSRKGGLIFMYMSDTPVYNLIDTSKYVTGTYELGAYTSIICDLGVFVIDFSDLYTNYAGSYFAEYTVNNVDYDMTVVLDGDGSFYVYSDTYTTSAGKVNNDTNSVYYYNCFGPDNRLGTYYFEIIGDEIKIILDFKVTYTGDDVVQLGGKDLIGGISYKSGYCARLVYGRWGGNIQTTYNLPTEYSALTIYDVYDFAAGTLGTNNLSVVFDAFMSTPITLNKVAA